LASARGFLSLLTPTHVRADVFIVARGGDNLITRVSSTGAKIALVDTGLSHPQAVAYDADGDLYVADRGSNHVLRFPANGGGPARVGDSVNGTVEIASELGDALLFAVRSAQSRVVAFSGQTLSQPQDAQFASFGSPAIGGESVAFRGTLKSGVAGVASGNSFGIWCANGSGAVELVARKAFEAFGASGAVFARLGEPALNENGDIAFLGKMRAGVGGLTSANAAGVWADVNAGLSRVAPQGDPAAGLDSGVVFASCPIPVLLFSPRRSLARVFPLRTTRA
jgi:hypothetical protein